jgi:hypothetical protein
MDIKSALNQIIPIQTRAKSNVEKPLKMDGATERDGNGQQAYQNPNQNKQPMSDQEFDYSVKLLETFPARKSQICSDQRAQRHGFKKSHRGRAGQFVRKPRH